MRSISQNCDSQTTTQVITAVGLVAVTRDTRESKPCLSDVRPPMAGSIPAHPMASPAGVPFAPWGQPYFAASAAGRTQHAAADRANRLAALPVNHGRVWAALVLGHASRN
jgi:hypothetical protein